MGKDGKESLFLVGEHDSDWGLGRKMFGREMSGEKFREIHDRLHSTAFYKRQDAGAGRCEDGAGRCIDRFLHRYRAIHGNQTAGFFSGFGKKKDISQSCDQTIPLREGILRRPFPELAFGDDEPSVGDDLLDQCPFRPLGISSEASA